MWTSSRSGLPDGRPSGRFISPGSVRRTPELLEVAVGLHMMVSQLTTAMAQSKGDTTVHAHGTRCVLGKN
ncbi:hypothetical protein BDA96_02G066500 [Sorghum bicolor]|uniref:Uncharacterized protein n=1 Tax=Sorghum bicolor TaxID=4558 RepID=A0A921RM86_SORBI|nr:hypothetical protein BDA96_02G066500 [Sorghum bicolor]